MKFVRPIMTGLVFTAAATAYAGEAPPPKPLTYDESLAKTACVYANTLYSEGSVMIVNNTRYLCKISDINDKNSRLKWYEISPMGNISAQ